MSAKIAMVAICAAFVMFCSFALSNAQAPQAPMAGQVPAGASADSQAPSQLANSTSVPAGAIQAGPGQVAAPAPITKVLSPPNSGFPAPAAPGSRPGPATNSIEPAGSIRSKRQAGIPPVCCTKDPCDPCATTPCIACPLCG